jgi:hypothetical protein
MRRLQQSVPIEASVNESWQFERGLTGLRSDGDAFTMSQSHVPFTPDLFREQAIHIEQKWK